MLKKYPKLQKMMPYLFWTLLAITTLLLLIELAPSKGNILHADKIAHACIFLLLSTIGYLSFPKHRTFVILGLVLYGAFSEVLQNLLTVTRNASLYDWIADITGILLCLLMIYCFKQQPKTQHDRRV